MLLSVAQSLIKVPEAGCAIPCPKPFIKVVTMVMIQIKYLENMKESLVGCYSDKVGKIRDMIKGMLNRDP